MRIPPYVGNESAWAQMPGGWHEGQHRTCGTVGTIQEAGPDGSVLVSFRGEQAYRFHGPILAALGATDPSRTVMDVLRSKHPAAAPLPKDSPGLLRSQECLPSAEELRVFFSAEITRDLIRQCANQTGGACGVSWEWMA